MGHRAVKCEPAAVGTEHKVADVHGDGCQLLHLAPARWDGIDVRGRQLVVRLVDTLRGEIDLRAIAVPGRLILVELALGELHRPGNLIGAGGQLHHPDVIVTLGIEIALTVGAIYRAANYMHIGLVLGWRGGSLSLAGMACGCLLRAFLFARRLFNVLGRGRTQEGDVLAVGRPDRVAGAFGQVGDDGRFPTRQRQHRDLRRLRFAALILVSATHECHAAPVGGPARMGVMLAVGQAQRRLPARCRHAPDRGFVSGALLVNADASECHLGSIRRQLRSGNPEEVEQVFFADRPLAAGSAPGARRRTPGLLTIGRYCGQEHGCADKREDGTQG
jgi:hypothetical protein